MMKSVFLILGHANSGQLKRLINKLNVEQSTIFLQVDLKADISLFKEYDNYSNVSFIKNRIRISWGSDELVFQTILYNSKYKEQMVNNNLRYIDLSQGKARPKVLDITDSENLRRSEKFFARKFDENVDTEILDWIDANLLTEKII